MSAEDNFEHSQDRSNMPARRAAAITPHNTNELSNVTRGIYVGVAGDVEVVTIGGDTVVFKNAVAGSVLPVCAKIVKAANTTATNLVALW